VSPPGPVSKANRVTGRLDPRAVVSLLVLKLGLAGCQRQVQYPVREVVDSGFGTATVAVRFNECPSVTFTVSPSQARIGESLVVAARALDTDHGAPMAYSWKASAGFFAGDSSAETIYTCPGLDHAGPQSLTLSVSDGSCVINQTVTVTCLALADGGGPSTTGGGGAGDARASCVHADSTTCEGEPCNRCTSSNCDTLAGQTATPAAGCDIFASQDQQARCQRLYTCMRDSGCVQNNDPTRCWCGSVDAFLCETGGQAPGGPCVQQFIDAAESNMATVINDRLTDPSFPIGGAINLVSCRSVHCSRLSDPPNPVCSL
jgi:hypothetical protein